MNEQKKPEYILFAGKVIKFYTEFIILELDNKEFVMLPTGRVMEIRCRQLNEGSGFDLAQRFEGVSVELFAKPIEEVVATTIWKGK